MKPAKTSIIYSAILVCITASVACGQEYLSNLANKWIDPLNPDVHTIGDIEVLDYWYGPFIVYFSTGSGSGQSGYAKMYRGVPRAVSTNSPVTIEQFRLNSATFEFLGSPTSPWTNISMTIQVFQQVGTNSVLVGEVGE